MTSKVYFIDMRTNANENFLDKIERLLSESKINNIISNKNIVAVKMHFGEYGNTAFIKPIYISKIIEKIKKINGIPFLTDANTLYSGSRSDAISHLKTAIKNGFAYSVVRAPIIIADGLRGKSEKKIKINQKHFKNVYVSKEIYEADILISVAHFKAHELSGFGGTIKNLGMGCASRKGKLSQHSSLSPKINTKKCQSCYTCIKHCSSKAIKMKNNKPHIENKYCTGCGECIIMCLNKAVQIRWNKLIPSFMEKMVEYTKGVLLNKKNKSLFINFITDVSPSCDCHPSNDSPIVKNIGVLCSNDPVAIDQASVDLVNNEQGLNDTVIGKILPPGKDKFKALYPKVNWELQLEYAKKLQLGSCTYNLIKI